MGEGWEVREGERWEVGDGRWKVGEGRTRKWKGQRGGMDEREEGWVGGRRDGEGSWLTSHLPPAADWAPPSSHPTSSQELSR